MIQTAGGGGGALSVSLSNVSKSGSGPTPFGNPGSTSIPVVGIGGGSGDYTATWSRLSGTPDYGPWVCSNVNTLLPTWHAPDPVGANAVSSSETWQLEVIDNQSGGYGKASNTVTIFWVDTR